MSADLERRLLRFLEREEIGEQRFHEELRAMPVGTRVLEGECIAAARLESAQGDRFTFRVEENLSKFRDGDPVRAGDGLRAHESVPLIYRAFDAESGRLELEMDPFVRGETRSLQIGQEYCIDRRSLGLGGRLAASVRSAFAEPRLRALLERRLPHAEDPQRRARAADALAALGLNAAQVEAGAAAIATEDGALVQGPPGTGKTRLLAAVLGALAQRGCRIALSAFTHRAVDNALLALRRAAPDVAAVKLDHPRRENEELRRAGVRVLPPRSNQIPASNVVVAGTCFSLSKLAPGQQFHYAVFDEAGQLPIPHAIVGMLLAQRWLWFGDHAQLPPVVTAHHLDREITRSVFEHLTQGMTPHLLDVTYRMNDAVCRAVSQAFYGGRLRPAPEVGARRLPFRPGGTHDALLDPERGAVWAAVDHSMPGMRSQLEAQLAAGLVAEAVTRHGLPAAEVAVVAPFRAQVRQVRSAMQRLRLPALEPVVVDTVERIQGQEREMVVISLGSGDPDALARRAEFFFSTNRLNVALSRARTKAVLIAAPGVFRALPREPDALRAASVWRRLAAALPRVGDIPAAQAEL